MTIMHVDMGQTVPAMAVPVQPASVIAKPRSGCPPGPVSVATRERQQPPFGDVHRLHRDAAGSGTLFEDDRAFTKQTFNGRLSVITEDQVQTQGVLRYALQFSDGPLSSADGVGFVFAQRLPCPKNIQKLVSIFVNRTGRICMRALSEVIRYDVGVKQLEVGDWVELMVDLEAQVAEFTVWDSTNGGSSSASFAFGRELHHLRQKLPSIPQASSGYFACVMKHVGVTVRLGS
jgi:hypothetical protein